MVTTANNKTMIGKLSTQKIERAEPMINKHPLKPIKFKILHDSLKSWRVSLITVFYESWFRFIKLVSVLQHETELWYKWIYPFERRILYFQKFKSVKVQVPTSISLEPDSYTQLCVSGLSLYIFNPRFMQKSDAT